MAHKGKAKLEEYMRSKALVRFENRFEAGWTRGYVLDIGPRFFLLLLVSDRIRFDGFECHRIADVRKLRVDPYARFMEDALRLKGEELGTAPEVSLSGTSEMLDTVASLSLLVTIDRLKVKPDVSCIGKVLALKKGRVHLLEIGPDAVWEDEPSVYGLRDITRVAWGGEYEEALLLVGGAAPGVPEGLPKSPRSKRAYPRG